MLSGVLVYEQHLFIYNQYLVMKNKREVKKMAESKTRGSIFLGGVFLIVAICLFIAVESLAGRSLVEEFRPF